MNEHSRPHPTRRPPTDGPAESPIERIVFPGTFNPPTVGHLAIVETVIARHRPRSLDLAISLRPLLKEHVERPTLAHRLAVIEESFGHLSEVRVVTTERRLIAEIAAGYDAVVMGADKWHQIHELHFYADVTERDRALASLPRVLVVDRGTDPVPDDKRLVVDGGIDTVSSTRARAGEIELMTAAATRFDRLTGAWTDHGRYDRWRP